MDTTNTSTPVTKPRSFSKILSYIVCSGLSIFVGMALMYVIMQDTPINQEEAQSPVESDNSDEVFEEPDTDGLIEELKEDQGEDSGEEVDNSGDDSDEPIVDEGDEEESTEPVTITNSRFFYKVTVPANWKIVNGVNEVVTTTTTDESDIQFDDKSIGDSNDMWISSRDELTFPTEEECLATSGVGNELVKSYDQSFNGIDFKVDEYRNLDYKAYWWKFKTWHASKEQCVTVILFDNLKQTHKEDLDKVLKTFEIFE